MFTVGRSRINLRTVAPFSVAPTMLKEVVGQRSRIMRFHCKLKTINIS